MIPQGVQPGTSTGATSVGSRERVSINRNTSEATMSTSDMHTETEAQVPATRTPDFKLEVTILPVSDAERAKQFYASLGWRQDADFVLSEDLRVLQFTPPGSQASIIFGTGVTPATPGSGGTLLLTVDDIEAARTELIERGADVSEIFHGRGFSDAGQGRVPGPAPDGESYGSFATFSDPDGNDFLLQEVTTRLPGRVEEPDIAALSGLLLETALAHGRFEAVAPEHNWWDWYAAYFSARQHGGTPEQATTAADRYMKEVHGVVPR
jgi:catechol 2,3-dioxygenase-like lactoylglutathione lyase family enzyme